MSEGPPWMAGPHSIYSCGLSVREKLDEAGIGCTPG